MPSLDHLAAFRNLPIEYIQSDYSFYLKTKQNKKQPNSTIN